MISKWFESGWTLHKFTSTGVDTWGNPVEGWSTGTAISGRFRQLSGDKRLSADKQTEFADAKFYCAYSTGVAVGDQLRKGSDYYEVKFVHNPMDMDRFLQVEVRKV
jgi:head-tail adaptor